MMGHRLGKEVSGSNIPIAKQITLPYPSVVSSSLSKDTYDEVYESRLTRCSCVGGAKATDNGDIAVLGTKIHALFIVMPKLFLAATKQLYKWYFPFVCPSVRPSVTPFWLCSHHRIIMTFSGVITNDQSKFHAKGQGQRSKVKVTEVTTQLNRFRTVTPVWIHIW